MTIAVGDTLPDAAFVRMGPDGPEAVQLGDIVRGKKVVLFGLPGAFTPTCDAAHVPSFMRTAEAFKAKGVEEIICLSVNDPFVLGAWAEQTGATAAGITLLGDADGSFTKAIGMDFTAPPIGLIGRSNRYATLVEDGKITAVSIDEPGVCDISTGERFLDAI